MDIVILVFHAVIMLIESFKYRQICNFNFCISLVTISLIN